MCIRDSCLSARAVKNPIALYKSEHCLVDHFLSDCAVAKEATIENKAVNINNLRNVIVSPFLMYLYIKLSTHF